MSDARETKPFGAWESPIAPADLAEGTLKIEQIKLDGDSIVWTEARPQEGGRSAVMRWTRNAGVVDVLPRWYDARSIVNSYGGGAMGVRDGMLVFTQYAAAALPKTRDQRVHRQDPGKLPVPITPLADATYADFEIDAARAVVYAVMEEAGVITRGQPTQTPVALDLAGERPPRVLAEGGDFYAAPVAGRAATGMDHLELSLDAVGGDRVKDGRDRDPSGALHDVRKVAGSPAESEDAGTNPILKEAMRFSEAVVQPLWSPGGVLHAVSDKVAIDGDRWNNICRCVNGTLSPITRETAELAPPAWRLGGASYGFVSDEEILAAPNRNGTSSLVRVDTATGPITVMDTPFTSIEHLCVSDGAAVFVGASFTDPPGIRRMDLATGTIELIRTTRLPLNADVAACIAAPRAMTFPTGPTGADEAHAFHYAPQNPRFVAPRDERPPLIVMIHGGPTAAARSALDLTIPFFTSRGFAVVDVNYRGSSGFGRAFRRAIYGGWGQVDVEDCVAAVGALVAEGLADPHRVVSRGGSSGGYTTLALATFTDLLSAAASYYGISNLEMIARVTDKLEAHYAELLLGPYPAAAKLFRDRSPLFHADRIDCPIILFRGTEDPVVPPDQAHVLINELNSRKRPHAYEFYEGESHGFRKASTIIGALEEELSFYGTMLGFVPSGPLKTPRIHNQGDG
ncbi:Prolyl tripeptidyl peptidase precursor [Jannaschia seosinensis]|uniref:Prolyl tripeptidyl peptidase n=1 Tax=Jannaschia seosinensis TaxID=313367 RepID=A0A0M7B7U0_9RHOB|nr:prolyl oligopeptidase family serine peptidase [Jannaschia seosinensis]CUH22317.1 Prolyl tripeptidyl peptidase precursor [Jannaschia seosinensis]